MLGPAPLSSAALLLRSNSCFSSTDKGAAISAMLSIPPFSGKVAANAGLTSELLPPCSSDALVLSPAKFLFFVPEIALPASLNSNMPVDVAPPLAGTLLSTWNFAVAGKI
jgi:hypothetical protein